MKVVLIDAYSLIYRAYHALPSDLATSKGEKTNAIYGFCNMLVQVINRENPDSIAVAFDVGKAFRHDEFVEYKAQRAPMPDDLQAQIGRVRQVIAAFDIPVYEVPGYEADDVIGSLAKKLSSQGHQVVIVTGDKDFLQLVSDSVSVVLPARGRFSEVQVYTPDLVRQQYGFDPRYIVDFKALMGDASDNIPGVPGVGEKTARSLIQTFGSLQNILENVDSIKPERIRNAIKEHQSQLIQNLRLATIVTDIDVDIEPVISRAWAPDMQKVNEIFRELEFRSLMYRLPKYFEPQNTSSEKVAPVERNEQPQIQEKYEIVSDQESLRRLVRDLLAKEYIAFDTETSGKNVMESDLVGVSFSPEAGTAYYFPINGFSDDGTKDLLDELSPLLEGGPKKIAHNAKFDYMALYKHGIRVSPLYFDTSIAAFLLNETSVGLKDLAATRLGIQMTTIDSLIGKGKNQKTMLEVSVDECARYACADADMTFRLFTMLEKEIAERKLQDLFYTLEMPLVPVLADMEMTGVAIDADALKSLSTKLYEQIRDIESQIYEIAGYEFNLKSPQQLSKFLFQDLGLKGIRKTSKGYSTDAATLEALSGQHPVIDLILSYRQLTKLKDTYVDALPLMVSRSTGRLHTNFSQTSAVTGRLASSDPNLQNIPIRSSLGKEVRKAFVAGSPEKNNAIFDEPSVLLSADYSQIELRVLAHVTDEPKLKEAFSRDIDIHALTASRLFGVPIESVDDNMRRMGKTINFGIIYGMSGFRLARDTGLEQREANLFVKRYMDQFPRVKAYFEQLIKEAEKKGYVETPLGRRRYLPDITSSNPQRREAARRAAINMPIQGMAADIIKQAMIDVHSALEREGIKAKMILQVHDELLFEVAESQLDRAAEVIVREMSTAFDLSVPLVVEAEYGPNWGEMTPIRKVSAGQEANA